MKIISSQHYLNPEIVEQKMIELEGATHVTLPCYAVGEEVEDGDLAILCDGHHTLAAARELGITFGFEIIRNPDDLTGEALLDTQWIDADWYYVESSDPSNEQFDLVW